MPIQKFPADATAVSTPKNRQIASYRQEKPAADIRSQQADMRPFSWQLGTAAGSYDSTPPTFKTLLGSTSPIDVGSIATQEPGYMFITAGDSTALMPVRRQEREPVEKSKPAVELRAGRGPSNYRSDEEAQADYDDMLAEGYTREENRRQREIATDLAERVISAEPWVRDAGFAPEWLNKGSSLVSPFEGAKLLAMPWFIAKKMGQDGIWKAFQRQVTLDAAGDPTGRQILKYLDTDRGIHPSYGVLDEGLASPADRGLWEDRVAILPPAEREDALSGGFIGFNEDDFPLYLTRAEADKVYGVNQARAARADAARRASIKSWLHRTDAEDAAVKLQPYRTPEEKAAEAREMAVKAAAEKRKEAMDQEILYEELDYAGRHGYLDGQGNFVPMPVGEVTRSYVDRPTRRFLYRGTPGSKDAAKATHIYSLYHPVEDLMDPRPPLRRTPEELDAYLGGLVEDMEP